MNGRYCAACGQEARPLNPDVRTLLHDVAEEVLSFDGRILRTLRRLFTAPGFLTREHVEGRRASWLPPLRLYLLASVVYFGLVAMVGDRVVRIQVSGDEKVDVVLQGMGFRNEEELRQALAIARATWMPRVMFVLVPAFAWLVSRVRRTAGRRYPAHVIFALHLHAAWFAARSLTTLAAAPMPEGVRGAIESLTSLYIVVYLGLAFRTAYGGTTGLAVRDTLIVVLVYGFVLVLVTGIVVGLAMFGTGWLASLTARLSG